MKKTIDKHDFIEEFKAYGRMDGYSFDGLTAIFGYLEEMESDTGEEMELDVIAICCDFSEYDEDGLKSDYGYIMDESEECEIEELISELRDRTTVVEFEGGWIIQAF